MPDKAKDTARQVVAKVVKEVMEKLESKTIEAIRGSLNKQRRTSRPRFSDIDWPRTIRRNLQHWQEEHRTIVPERLVGYGRHARRSNLEQVILCVDQSGSMGNLGGLFLDLRRSARLDPRHCHQAGRVRHGHRRPHRGPEDPVDVLFGVQLGGGTDINQALAYCERLVAEPTKTHLVLISDLYEGGNAAEMLARAKALVAGGVNVIVLLALNDDGRPAYDANSCRRVRRHGLPGVCLHTRSVPGADGDGAQAGRHLGVGGITRHSARQSGRSVLTKSTASLRPVPCGLCAYDHGAEFCSREPPAQRELGHSVMIAHRVRRPGTKMVNCAFNEQPHHDPQHGCGPA